MNLVEQFVDFAESNYSINWAAIQGSVAAQLGLTSSFDTAVYDPRHYPSYWYVPLCVGNYVGASRRAILDDTEAFVRGCIIRHFMFERDRRFDASRDMDGFRSMLDAYDGCRADGEMGSTFDERFSAKCLPWMVLLGIGTHSISAEVDEQTDYAPAMKAIVLVHSCLQIVDDWHDKQEDGGRSHWNMWVHESVDDVLSVIEPLVCGSRLSVERLRPHLLRRVLGVQLQDTAKELRDVVRELGTSQTRSRSLRATSYHGAAPGNSHESRGGVP